MTIQIHFTERRFLFLALLFVLMGSFFAVMDFGDEAITGQAFNFRVLAPTQQQIAQASQAMYGRAPNQNSYVIAPSALDSRIPLSDWKTEVIAENDIGVPQVSKERSKGDDSLVQSMQVEQSYSITEVPQQMDSFQQMVQTFNMRMQDMQNQILQLQSEVSRLLAENELLRSQFRIASVDDDICKLHINENNCNNDPTCFFYYPADPDYKAKCPRGDGVHGCCGAK